MHNQSELIHEREWDWLLILDACRFDTFEALYENYLEGDLQQVRSPASQTMEWLSKTWPDAYNITYVSAHPNINSEGIRGNEPTRVGISDVPGADPAYLPADHFDDIVDVWDFGYNEAIETVHPEAMNAALRDVDPPCVGHYVQPHFPWNRGSLWAESQDVEIPNTPRTEMDPVESTREPRFSRRRVKSLLGEDGVKYAYKDNLEFVLERVSAAVTDLPGTVVITADHGELMTGPDAHPAGRDDHVLRVVPWFEVE